MIRLACIFAIFSASCLLGAVLKHGSLWWLWPAVAFGMVSVAYFGVGAGAFGKDQNGRLSVWRTILMLPFLLMTWVLWHVRSRALREPAAQEITPGLWLGRRPFLHELPVGIECVLDLTAEFPRVRLPAKVRYIACPALDYGAPSPAQFDAALASLGQSPCYIHCAMGRGRSAAFVAALLIRRGVARDVNEAIGLMQTHRPCVRLNSCQRHFVESTMRPN